MTFVCVCPDGPRDHSHTLLCVYRNTSGFDAPTPTGPASMPDQPPTPVNDSRRPVVVVDTETSGLHVHLGHRPWEVAYARIDSGRPIDRARTRIRSWRWPLSDVEVAAADPGALRVNRYLQRVAASATGHVQPAVGFRPRAVAEFHPPSPTSPTSDDVWVDRTRLLPWLWRQLDGVTLAGANVAFDRDMLNAAFVDVGLPRDPWHHRLLDVYAVAAGRLGTTDLAPAAFRDALGVPSPGAEAHTAAGDVEWTLNMLAAALTPHKDSDDD